MKVTKLRVRARSKNTKDISYYLIFKEMSLELLGSFGLNVLAGFPFNIFGRGD